MNDTPYLAKAPPKSVDQLGHKPKRFWTQASIEPKGDGFVIMLDGRAVKTPMGAELILLSPVLAEAIAKEWHAVSGHIEFTHMPLTRLGFSAVDRFGAPAHNPMPEEALTELLAYGNSDLLCYPSTYPQALVEREAALWTPILHWANEELGLRFEPSASIIHRPQPLATMEGLKALGLTLNPYQASALMVAIPLFGSVILALGLMKGRLSALDAHQSVCVGEQFQAQTWGHDAENQKRHESWLNEAQNLELWFKALN